MKDYIDLFIIFARIGAVTFGGGYVMLPILQKEIVEVRQWATSEEIMDYYAISQCTPGIIAINTAIFIGYKCKKELGGVFAALGMVFPSIVIILIISIFLQNVMSYQIVQMAFRGIRVAVAVLVFNATVTLSKKGIIGKLSALIFVISFAVLFLIDISPILVVVLSALVGILVKMKEKEDKQ